MPHLILDTCSSLKNRISTESLLAELVETFSRVPTVNSSALKAYVRWHDEWKMGEGAAPAFLHCTACVLSGRHVELRKQMAQTLLEVLIKQLAELLDAKEVQVTVEIREMDSETYLKS
jgi:5-carboxymethyl-2-hydroxymuconate isomerase